MYGQFCQALACSGSTLKSSNLARARKKKYGLVPPLAQHLEAAHPSDDDVTRWRNRRSRLKKPTQTPRQQKNASKEISVTE